MTRFAHDKRLRKLACVVRAVAMSMTVAVCGVHSGAVHAQDDDLPDGDVDLIERPAPKKKRDTKKDAKRAPDKEAGDANADKKDADKKDADKKDADKKDVDKKDADKKDADKKDVDNDRVKKNGDKASSNSGAEKSADQDAETKKAADKKAPDAKPSKEVEKAGKKKAAFIDDDSDILTVGPMDAPKATPSKVQAAAAPSEARDEGGSRVIIADDTPTPAVDDAPREPVVAEVDEPKSEPVVAAAVIANESSAVTVVQTVADEPDEGGSATPWIVAGAAGGGLVLLAGAGVGAYFLISALTSQPTGTVTVVPR